jgi:C-terminal processing protease CtpA/Prc
MRLSLAVLMAAAFVLPAGPALAQPATQAVAPSPAMDAAEQRAVVEALAHALDEQFVFPDVAKRYAATLRRNLASGAYASLTDPAEFGRRVTADLQAVAPDAHLKLATKEALRQTVRATGTGAASSLGKAPEALEAARMIGDVAYLSFNLFPNDPAVAARARAFLAEHAGDAKAVVIDCRGNRGGTTMVIDAILPLLFAERTTLVRMDTRAAASDPEDEKDPAVVRQGSPPEFVRLDHVVTPDMAERRLQRVPVYYLTSRRTGSAAEHLALAFKRTGRATVIGEPTAGAGHFGGFVPVGQRFAAFIPNGRTYDPATGEGWEGKGVAPDVAIAADQALDEALRRVAAGPRI